MNKTVNINLAGILFHIDEDAFQRLQNYLNTIKRSFVNEVGKDEIISDIEARIAELFSQKRSDTSQVINTADVEEMISIMGEPEDYNVDDELFESAEPKTTQQRTIKRLFRDPSNSYVGGVTSGLGHYFGIDPIWLRLSWIVLTLSSGGGFILIYLSLWIFVPEAKTTVDRLVMKGEPINVSNIERKIKEGFDNVSDTVKNADYTSLKNSTSTFFDNLISVFTFLFTALGKFIGVLFILMASFALIMLSLSFLSVLGLNIIHADWLTHIDAMDIVFPIWIASLLGYFAIGIPFFFLLILGLKMIIKNLKSIGKPAKLTLLGIWIISLLSLLFLGIRQSTIDDYSASTTTTHELPLSENDTLRLRMRIDERYINNLRYDNDFDFRKNEEGSDILVNKDIRIYLETKKFGPPTLTIAKKADGNSYDTAKLRSEGIKYSYELEENTLWLNGYNLINFTDKIADQKVTITLSIPESMTLLPYNGTRSYNSNRRYGNRSIIKGKEGNYLNFRDGKVLCPTCKSNKTKNRTTKSKKPDWENDHYDKDIDINLEENGENFRLKIDENGIRINNKQIIKHRDWDDDDGLDIDFENEDGKNFNLKIDEDGIRINNKPIDVKIDEDGIQINNSQN